MYSNLSLYFSSDCPHSCTYCTINKHRPDMAKNNGKIREDILSGRYANNVILRFENKKNVIDLISLWGMEPTVNTDIGPLVLKPLFDFFPKVQTLFFSTNAWLGWEKIKPIIYFLRDYNLQEARLINLDIQVSLDGPKWINDPSRRLGATENTLQVLRDMITSIPHDLGYQIKITTKPTVDVKYIKYMVEHGDKMYEWYSFMDSLQSELNGLNTNSNVSIIAAQPPTLVNPGTHTQEDGKALAGFIRKLRELDISNLKHYKHPLILQPLRGISEALKVDNKIDLSHWGCCSSGRYTANINSDGELFSCHALFDRSYINSSSVITKGHTTHLDQNSKRLQYVDLLWMEYPESRMKFWEIITLGLVAAGQIDAIYNDSQYRKLLFYSLGGVFCPYVQAESTSSIWSYTTSQIKYFGNGAVQEILGYLKDCNMLGEKHE